MITMKNEEKSLVKDIQYNCRYTFNGTACNLNQKWSNNKWKFESKSIEREKKKIIIGFLALVFWRIVDI